MRSNSAKRLETGDGGQVEAGFGGSIRAESCETGRMWKPRPSGSSLEPQEEEDGEEGGGRREEMLVSAAFCRFLISSSEISVSSRNAPTDTELLNNFCFPEMLVHTYTHTHTL